MSMQTEQARPDHSRSLRRFFRREPWERAMMVLIGAGVVMLTQPFSLWLFGQSFTVILIGTIGYVIVSHFPE
ncbi:MAG: hypothetical protein ACLFPA_10960 [Dichotomicrobium sp.]